jgi:hypothetical protein
MFGVSSWQEGYFSEVSSCVKCFMSDSVLSKLQNYRLWQDGAFGNKLRSWRTVDEWRDSGFDGKVVLRTLLEGGGGPCRYNLLPEEVDSVVDCWLALDIPPAMIMVNEAAPDTDVILQGEYLNDIYAMDGEAGWGYFRYSRVRAQMRDALAAAPEVAQRLRSDLLLKLAMTPASHEDWNLLLGQYPGHVLEVSIYDRCLGDTPGRNALVWEVRKY